MNDMTIAQNTEIAARMTSKEIAELVEKRHDNVKRTIETLAGNGVIQLPQIEEVKDNQSLSPNSKAKAYVFDADHKRDTYVVVAQLSPEFTARIVDRWQELEGRHAPQLPNFDDPVAAARAWADEREHRLKLEGQTRALEQQIETDRPYTEIARAITGQHTMTRRDWCALLKNEHGASIGEKKLNQWLRDKGYIYMDRLDNTARAYAGYSNLFKLEVEILNGYPRNVLKLTGQGVLELTPKILADFGYTQADAA